jgi:hypothetical protein
LSSNHPSVVSSQTRHSAVEILSTLSHSTTEELPFSVTGLDSGSFVLSSPPSSLASSITSITDLFSEPEEPSSNFSTLSFQQQEQEEDDLFDKVERDEFDTGSKERKGENSTGWFDYFKPIAYILVGSVIAGLFGATVVRKRRTSYTRSDTDD